MSRLTRRTFLRAGGVAVALPALEAMLAPGRKNAYGQSATAPPRRMVVICTTLGLHAPNLYPESTGPELAATPYLDRLESHRADLTLFSGLSHPDQSGADGHSNEMTFLTSAPHPGLAGFRNTISVDQFAAEQLGYVTRFPSLTLSTDNWKSQSYTRSGVLVPAESKPSELFAKMFLTGKPKDVERQRRKLNNGRSIFDKLLLQTRKLRRQVSATDRERLDEYFDSIREAERKLAMAGEWLEQPKPEVDVDPPKDIEDEADVIGKMRLLLDLVPLAVQTDSTRVITLKVGNRGEKLPIEGVTMDHHNLSHHGKDAAKLEQLKIVETELISAYGNLLGQLKQKREDGGSLLDNTMVLFGSNLGNANAHDWRNLPILFSGGGFNHGSHVALDKENNTPLSNLYVTMLQRMGIETNRFGTSTGALKWSA